MKTDAERLDNQAAAIRDLRKRVAALEAALLEHKHSPVLAPSTGLTETEQWTPRPDCLVCHKPKAKNRATMLTCQPCGATRNSIIRTKGADRSPISRDDCGQCGAAKAHDTRILCPPCSAAYAAFSKSGARP